MTSLWDAGAILETIRKMVAVEHRDPIAEFAQYSGGGEAREAPPDNNRVGSSHRRRSITRAGLCGAESEINEVAAEEKFPVAESSAATSAHPYSYTPDCCRLAAFTGRARQQQCHDSIEAHPNSKSKRGSVGIHVAILFHIPTQMRLIMPDPNAPCPCGSGRLYKDCCGKTK